MLEHPPVRRNRRSRSEWQALVDDCVSSGLSPRQFCQQKELNYHRFRIWQRRLDAATFDGMFVEIPQQASRSPNWTTRPPIKAGRKKKGYMRQAYYWPIYGDADEVVFCYAATRAHRWVGQFLGEFEGTLLSDGYQAYQRYAEKRDSVTHATCWAHLRGCFEQAIGHDAGADQALDIIAALYRIEAEMKASNISREQKLAWRSEKSKPIVDDFFEFCKEQCQRYDLLPQDKFSKALNYAREREASSRIFLSDPRHPDTHPRRATSVGPLIPPDLHPSRRAAPIQLGTLLTFPILIQSTIDKIGVDSLLTHEPAMYEDAIRKLADGKNHSVASLQLKESDLAPLAAYLTDLGIEYQAGGGELQVVGGLELFEADRVLAYMDEEARQLLQRIEIHWTIDSTNTYLLKRSLKHTCHGEVSIAEQQTQGRGRRGKNWVSPFGRNLYMSVAWSMPTAGQPVDGLSLAVGVGVVRGLSACGVEGVQLKWPNDLLFEGGKLGGILIEISNPKMDVVEIVVGVGINLQMPLASGRIIDQKWTDMTRVTGRRISRNLVAAKVLDFLLGTLNTFPEKGFKSYRSDWQAHDAFKELAVEVHVGNETIAGIEKGVDDRGALCLQTEMGIRYFVGGEVSLRAAAK